MVMIDLVCVRISKWKKWLYGLEEDCRTNEFKSDGLHCSDNINLHAGFEPVDSEIAKPIRVISRRTRWRPTHQPLSGGRLDIAVLRAEPVAAMYQQGRVKHVDPPPAELEDEMCDFGLGGLSSGGSPDRLDALVWAITELMGRAAGGPRIRRV